MTNTNSTDTQILILPDKKEEKKRLVLEFNNLQGIDSQR